MTAYHAFNCIALAFGPYAIVWYRVIADQDIFTLVLWSGIFYGLTQIVIMLALATFLPPPEEEGEFVALHEVGRTMISALNVGGIYLTLSMKAARQTSRHLKVLGVGFGWALAKSLLGTAGPLIYSAGSNEFNWDNPFTAMNCTVTLLATLATVGFVERCKKDGTSALPSIFIAALLCRSSLVVFLISVGIGQTSILGVSIALGWAACYLAGVRMEE
mgnify:FL=1